MFDAILLEFAKSTFETAASCAVGWIQQASGHKTELVRLQNSFYAISAVLQDAERKQACNAFIKNWLKDLKDLAYDIDDLLDEVATDALEHRLNQGLLKQIRNYASGVFSDDLVHKIKGIQERLDGLLADKRDFHLVEYDVHDPPIVGRSLRTTYSFVKESSIMGRRKDKEKILRCIMSIDQVSKLSVIPIVGLAGLGKTALSKLIFNDDRVGSKFALKLWVCVSKDFDLKTIMVDIIESATGEKKSNLRLETLQVKLRGILSEKSYFLVLDNVWIEDVNEWTELRDLFDNGANGSVILVTTRSAKVASVTGNKDPYNLGNLAFDVCWSIFSTCVFRRGQEELFPRLVRIGKDIVGKCGGVPLAVKTLGNLLCTERDEKVWLRIKESELWEIDQNHNDILPALKLSYDGIPSHLKSCLAYCSVFRKGEPIFKLSLIMMWMAQGFLQLSNRVEDLEDVGHRYFNELFSRSLFQDAAIVHNDGVYSCKLHDLVHDLASYVAEEERSVVSYDRLEVSNRVRHLVFDKDDLSGREFPRELLRAKKARTFMFACNMGPVSQRFLEGLIDNFKCLRVLDCKGAQFEELPKSIGSLKHLRHINLVWNVVLKVVPDSLCKLLNLQFLHLSYCYQLQRLPRGMNNLVSLRHLYLTSRQTTLPAKELQFLTSLSVLCISDCKGLTTLSEGIGYLTALKRLTITDCPNMASLPNIMKNLTALEELVIVDCEELDLSVGTGMLGLQSLRSLEIGGLPKLVALPDSLQSAMESLKYILVENCESLTAFPDWLPNFTCLVKLVIYDCLNLSALPMGVHSMVRELDVNGCPKLAKWRKKRGSANF